MYRDARLLTNLYLIFFIVRPKKHFQNFKNHCSLTYASSSFVSSFNVSLKQEICILSPDENVFNQSVSILPKPICSRWSFVLLKPQYTFQWEKQHKPSRCIIYIRKISCSLPWVRKITYVVNEIWLAIYSLNLRKQ